MIAAVKIEHESEIVYCLTEDPDAILADDDPIFVEDEDLLLTELAIRHDTPAGFSCINKGRSYSICLKDGELCHRNALASYAGTKPVDGISFTVTEEWTCTITDRKTIEDVARNNPGRKIVLNQEASMNWVEPEWRTGHLQVFPVGDFLVRLRHRGAEVEFNPKRAKSLTKQRATKKKKAIKNGEPNIILLKELQQELIASFDQHPIMKSKIIVLGDGREFSLQSKGQFYFYLPRLARIPQALYRKRVYQQSEGFKKALAELLPYVKGLSSIKPVQVPSPKWPDDLEQQYRYEHNMSNRTGIAKAKNHNHSVKHASFFARWLVLQAKACGLAVED